MASASDAITANLPSRSFAQTEAFYARLGFATQYSSDDWMILSRGTLLLEFFPHPDLDPTNSWFGACVRTSDLDGLLRDWGNLGLPTDAPAIPRLTGLFTPPGAPRMFALIDPDGSLLRCLDT